MVDDLEADVVAPTLSRRAGAGGCEPKSERRQEGQQVTVAALCLTTALAVLLLVARLPTVDLHAMTGLGLLSVLPFSTLAGLALLGVGFVGSLSLRRPHAWLLGIQLVILVLFLHGITVLVESEPRFPITWFHAGFVDFISRTGTVATELDARWCWPGFFALAAFWLGSGRLSTLSPVLSLAPVLSNLLYLGALALIMSAIKMSLQARWLAAVLFCLLNWIGQDYFSPQGFTYLLYLVFIGIVVKWFSSLERTVNRHCKPARVWHWVWQGSSSGELPSAPARPAERVVLLAILVGLFCAATVSHQLTPFVMVMSVVGLIVARRCTLTGLPTILIVILLAWISYMTEPYWAGHLKDMVGSVGDVSGTVSSSVVARASRGSDEHQLVGQARMLTAGLLVAMAAWGLLRRRRHGIEDRVLLVLVAVPVGLVFMQSYGGEIAFRVYLFMLGPACILAALSFFPDPESRPTALARGGVGLCVLALSFSFFVTRYGNEQFEQISDGAVAAVETVYSLTPNGGRFLFVSPHIPGDTPFIPVGYRDVERVDWDRLDAPIEPADVTGLVDVMREGGPGTYLITTRSQENYLTFGSGYPPDWGTQFRRAMAAAPGVRVVVDNPDASVYTFDWRPGQTPKPFIPPTTGVQIRRTPWTPVGVAFLVMALSLLGLREVWRVCPTRNDPRWLRLLTLAASPVLAGFVLVIAERFVVLTT
ncbi:hypothetical protein [Mycolicibacterium sarraceniae]|nr:hypothetical protein [Mycolicibacterium sarraceniae]